MTGASVCTIPVTFSPKYPGKRDTPLIVQTNLTVNSTSNFKYSFDLVGTGVAPQVGILPGVTSIVAGKGTPTNSGDDGQAINAGIKGLIALARDAAGNMYIAPYSSNLVRKIDSRGTITTFAGTGTSGNTGDGGPATSATFSTIVGLTVDALGSLYIADSSFNNRIRKVDVNGIVSTVLTAL